MVKSKRSRLKARQKKRSCPRNVGQISKVAPEQCAVKLAYQETWNANFGAYAYWNKVYSLNSAYDPLYTVGGGTCTGYVQWIALYRYCLVTSVTIKYSLYNSHAADAGYYLTMYAIPFASWQVGDSSSVPTLDLVRETPWSKWHDNFVGAHPHNPFTFTMTLDVAKLEGQPLVPKTSYSSTVDSDPSLQLTAQIGAIATDGTTTGQTAFGTVDISYVCTFYQKRVFSTT